MLRFRIQKDLRPHLSFSYRFPPSTTPYSFRKRFYTLSAHAQNELYACAFQYIGQRNWRHSILVPRGCAPFGQHQESRPLAKSNTGSPRFTDFPSLCACSESGLTNLISCDLNLLCLQSHSKTECHWTGPEVAILGSDQKERGLWGREWRHS